MYFRINDIHERFYMLMLYNIKQENYSPHFFLKKPRNYQSGPKAIYMRIIVAGSLPKESSIGRQCEPKNWIYSANRAKGNSENVRTLNAIDLEVEQSHTYLTKWGRKFRRRH